MYFLVFKHMLLFVVVFWPSQLWWASDLTSLKVQLIIKWFPFYHFSISFFFNKIQFNNDKIEDGQPSTNCSTVQYIKTTRERPPHAVHLRRLEQTNNTLVPTLLSGRPSSASAASSSAHYRLLKNLVRRADKSREQRSFKQGQFTAEHMFFVDDIAASRTIR